MEDAEFAILQCKSNKTITEEQNKLDLITELKLLTYGQYFAESFAA
jgi:hypothetical protein